MPNKVEELDKKILARLDELNVLVAEWLELPKFEATSEFEDFLIEAYLMGFSEAKEMLGETDNEDIKPRLYNFLNKEYQGETVGAKFSNYFDTADIESIKRLADSEYHRVFNQGIFQGAEEINWSVSKDENISSPFALPIRQVAGTEIVKTWVTMADEKVRLTHTFLEGVTIPLYEEFYTIDADHAMYPGEFQFASNTANCRCKIVLSRREIQQEQ